MSPAARCSLLCTHRGAVCCSLPSSFCRLHLGGSCSECWSRKWSCAARAVSQRSSGAQWVQPCQCMVAVVAVVLGIQAIGFFSLLKRLFLLVPVSCPAGLALAVRSKIVESCRLRMTFMIPQSNYQPDLLSPITRPNPLMPCPHVLKNWDTTTALGVAFILSFYIVDPGAPLHFHSHKGRCQCRFTQSCKIINSSLSCWSDLASDKK